MRISICSRKISLLLSVIVCLCAGSLASQATAGTYDAASSFEAGWTAQTNPNGVWSYGWSTGFTSPITLYTTEQIGSPTQTQLWVYPSIENGFSPNATLNNGPAYNDGNLDFLANELILTAGTGGQYSDLIFTAPVAGNYSLASSFRGAQSGVGTVVAVAQNGSVLFSSTVTADGEMVPFNSTLSLNAGDTVVFSVGPGGGNQNTGVSATFQLINPTVPTITWPNPAPITYGTALSAAQLDATASVPGTFVYAPAAGTVLPLGANTLSVVFTPTDLIDYTTATTTVQITVSPSAGTYDAASSFEAGWTAQTNPNGVWSYGWSTGFTAQITLYDQTAQNGINGPNAQYWLSSTVNSGTSPAAEYNNGPAYNDGNVNFLANQFVLVAGVAGQYSNLIFTAPATGTYSLISSFRGDQGGIGTVVAVMQNGTVLFNSTVTAEGQLVPFNASLSLNAGDTVVFSVGPGGGTQNTGVSATLQLTSKIVPTITWPPPAPITYGTALSATQLDATASVPGTFIYSPAAGTVPAAGVDTLSVTFTPTDTTTYATVTSTVQITVTQPTPTLTVAPASLAFTATSGGTNPVSQPIAISNVGVGSLNWTASNNQPWLLLDMTSGTAPSTINVSVNIAGLAAGTYQDTITVTAPGGSGSPATIPVILTLTTPSTPPFASIVTTSTSDEFSLVIGTQSNPSVVLTNSGTAAHSATITVLNPNSAPSLSVPGANPVSVPAGQSLSVPILIDAASASVGTYTGILMQISVDDGTTLYANITVNVLQQNLPDLSVTASDILPAVINADSSVTLTADVHNLGSLQASNVTVTFSEFGNLLGSTVISQIGANGTAAASITLPLANGNHLIQVVVDPNNSIQEISKNNNQATTIVLVGVTTPPTQGGLLVTGNIPSTVYSSSLFTVSGQAVYDIYSNGVEYTNYVVMGGSVQITMTASDGTTWTYGNGHTDINGNFSQTLQAPPTPGTYQIAMTVTDYTFTGTRQLAFAVVVAPSPTTPPPSTIAPSAWGGSGSYQFGGSCNCWTWTWTQLPPAVTPRSSNLWVDSSDITFSNDNPAPNSEITIIAQIHYWASDSTIVATNVPVNFYATAPGSTPIKLGQTTIDSLSILGPDYGARYVYATWKNPGTGVYIIEAEIDPSYAEQYMLDNAATRAIVVGTFQSAQGAISGHITTPLGAMANVPVTVVAANGLSLGTTITDQTGLYLMQSVPVGLTQISITVPAGYVPDAATKSATVSNQAISILDFHLTPQPAQTTPTITWATPASIVYGAALSATQLDATASVPGTFAYSPAAGTIPAAGVSTLSVTFTPTDTTTYATVTSTVSLVVSPAVLTVTANNASMTYGGSVPTLASTVAGFVNGDSSSVVSGSATETTTATTTSAPGAYPITFSQESLTAANYTFTYLSGTLTIAKASQTITFNSLPSVTYGTAALSLTAVASSGLPVSYTVTGPAAVNGATLSVTGTGTVMVTASQTGNADYFAATSVPQSFTVNRAPLTITANSASVISGQPLPVLTYTITGFVNGDNSTVVSGTATERTTATTSSGPGAYPITFSTEALTAANYTFNYVAGTLTISGGAAQTITFNPLPNSTIGAPPVTLKATASSGLPVSFVSLTTPVCTVSGSTLTIIAIGTCSVEATQNGNNVYGAAAPVTRSFSVLNARASFTIQPVPASETIKRGQLGAFALQLHSVSGFAGSVTLACAGGPPQSKCVNFPMTVKLNGSATALSGFAFPRTTQPGTYVLTFTGTSGQQTATATAKVTID